LENLEWTPKQFNFNWSSPPICQHMSDAFKLMPCSTYCQPPHLGLLPDFAVRFCFLRPGVRD